MRALTGKRVLVTGGVSGIGLATVARFETAFVTGSTIVVDGGESAGGWASQVE